MKKSDLAITISTVPNLDEAKNISRTLVEEKLAACVNIIPGATSIYSWEGKIEESSEVVLVIKSRAELYQKLEKRISDLHSYEVPEIVMLNAEDVEEKYLNWLDGNCA